MPTGPVTSSAPPSAAAARCSAPERQRELALASFHGGVEEPGRPNRRAARELALQRQRLLGGLRAEPRQLLAQQSELARRGRPVAACHVAAHERPVSLLVGGVLAQHLLPAALGAHQREAALAQPARGRRASTARRGRRAAAPRHMRSRRHARSARRRWSPRRPGRARPGRREARPRRARRARGARSSRPYAGWTRPHRRRGSARASRGSRRAACGGREPAQAASRDPPRAVAPTRPPGRLASRRTPRSVRAVGRRVASCRLASRDRQTDTVTRR